ncbi:hypothetical protein TTRE_0000528501 [Trichuris trichiura]|uniref:Uncharacterized protein n=1 Tax=Trichuris trichiura TaxID=36087 RepID=A0A077Z959_TRITR|nr:hypothetical protein TTRE_0000528501 [Trichuris trichiura]
MNKQLQEGDLNLIKTKFVISAFMSSLLSFKRNFARGELSQFQSLTQVGNESGISEADVEMYCEHLQALHNDFTRRFHDILSMILLQEELLELQLNVELKARLSQGYQQFWLQKEIPEFYPGVWSVVKSIVTDLLTKKRSQLQIVRHGDLRLRVTSIEPNIDRLVQSHLGEPSSFR